MALYLAKGRFRRRPPISALLIGLQRDIRAFFGSYASVCRQADNPLFRLLPFSFFLFPFSF